MTAPVSPSASTDTRSILIDGIWSPARSGRTIDVIDPGTGEAFTALSAGGPEDVDAAVAAARAAIDGAWGAKSAAERGEILTAVASRIAEHAEELGALESRDTGKPARQGLSDARFCAKYFAFYASAADKVHGETIPFQAGFTVMTILEPYGVTGHIVPWNYPMQIFGRSVAAALAAGNACVVKPAEDACLSLLRIGQLALEAGLPPGALNFVTGLGAEAGAALAGHPGIAHVSFTGSAATGTAVQQAAARNNASVVMELGGKSPQIVFDDADLDKAIPVLVGAIVQNAGQTCSAGSRVLVQEAIWDEVTARLGAAFAAIRVGYTTADLDCGPIINARQHARVRGMIDRAKQDGIPVVGEGEIAGDAPERGLYVRPVAFGPVPPESFIARDEVFGPVLALTPFRDEADAIRIANGTEYGLAAGIWTRDGSRAMRLARKVQAGQVFVNNYGAAGGVELPFGGVKRSGFGREKGIEGLKSFLVPKTVAIHHG